MRRTSHCGLLIRNQRGGSGGHPIHTHPCKSDPSFPLSRESILKNNFRKGIRYLDSTESCRILKLEDQTLGAILSFANVPYLLRLIVCTRSKK